MEKGVFDEGLENHIGNPVLLHLIGNIDFVFETVFEPDFLDIEIFLDVFQFF